MQAKLMRRLTIKLKPGRLRLVAAISAYGVLAVIAAFTLDGPIRIALLIFFGFLALKTVRHAQDEPMGSEKENSPPG